MNTIKKFIYTLLGLNLILLCFVGCEQKVKKVYVDVNGSEITKFPIIKMKYVCDERGYLYYEQHTYQNNIILPLFKNGSHGAYQIRCDEDFKN